MTGEGIRNHGLAHRRVLGPQNAYYEWAVSTLEMRKLRLAAVAGEFFR
jgi:hypothetical protein